MSFKDLIQNQINFALDYVDDLATDVLFIRNITQSFDFNSGETVRNNTNKLEYYLKAIELNYSKENNREILTVLLPQHDVDLSVYDFVVVNGKRWKVLPGISSDGYFITVRAEEVKNG